MAKQIIDLPRMNFDEIVADDVLFVRDLSERKDKQVSIGNISKAITSVNEEALSNKINELIQGAVDSFIDRIYPVGSIYMTMENINPADKFGGVWSKIEGRTLVGHDPNQTEFNQALKTGGAKTVALTHNQLPHSVFTVPHIAWTEPAFTAVGGAFNKNGPHVREGTGTSNNASVASWRHTIGNNEAHSNLQPYMVTYIWRRIS